MWHDGFGVKLVISIEFQRSSMAVRTLAIMPVLDSVDILVDLTDNWTMSIPAESDLIARLNVRSDNQDRITLGKICKLSRVSCDSDRDLPVAQYSRPNGVGKTFLAVRLYWKHVRSLFVERILRRGLGSGEWFQWQE